MQRIYKEQLQRFLLLALHCRDLGGDMRRAYDNARERYYVKYPDELDPKDPRALLGSALKFLPNMNSGEMPLEALITETAKMLVSKGAGVERDLIDMIVHTLSLPHVRNVISGEMIKALRQAILLPEEISLFKAKVDARELFCASCGHKFVNGEMSTMQTSKEGTAFHCTGCVRPNYVRCSGCMESANVFEQRHLGDVLGESYHCPKHRPVKGKKAGLGAGELAPDLEAIIVQANGPMEVVQPVAVPGGAYEHYLLRGVAAAAADPARGVGPQPRGRLGRLRPREE
jgi:hypothetical protein